MFKHSNSPTGRARAQRTPGKTAGSLQGASATRDRGAAPSAQADSAADDAAARSRDACYGGACGSKRTDSDDGMSLTIIVGASIAALVALVALLGLYAIWHKRKPTGTPKKAAFSESVGPVPLRCDSGGAHVPLPTKASAASYHSQAESSYIPPGGSFMGGGASAMGGGASAMGGGASAMSSWGAGILTVASLERQGSGAPSRRTTAEAWALARLASQQGSARADGEAQAVRPPSRGAWRFLSRHGSKGSGSSSGNSRRSRHHRRTRSYERTAIDPPSSEEEDSVMLRLPAAAPFALLQPLSRSNSLRASSPAVVESAADDAQAEGRAGAVQS